VKAAKEHAEKNGRPIPEEELKTGGSVYEQIRFDLRMQALVQQMVENEPSKKTV
jgi:hypothetical protein